MAEPERRALPWAAPATWARLAVLLVAYFAAAQLGLRFALSDAVASPIWPPAGLALAAAVAWGRRALPAVFVAVVAIEINAGVPIAGSLLMALGTTAEAAAAGWIVARAGGRAALARLPGVVALTAAAFLAPLLGATAGTWALFGSGIVPASAVAQVAATWYLGDVAGILVFGPPLLLFPRRWPSLDGRRLTEAAIALVALAAAAGTVFGLVSWPLAFIAIPPMVWIAARFGPSAGAWTVLALDGVAVVATASGHGPFATDSANTSFLLVQAYALTVSLLGLAVAALAADRQRFAVSLERRVAERTASLEAEVTHRRNAQQAADEAQKVAHMGTWRWDITKPHAEWSDELYRIYGLDPATHVPSYDDYLTRVHPEDVERVKAATEAVFQHQRPYSHDERVRRPDGTWRHLHTWAHAITDADGKLTALVGACQDITDRVAQETKFRGLLESAPDAMVIVDAAGRIVLVNGQAGRLFGYARDEMLGQPLDMLVPDAARGVHGGHRAKYMAAPQARPMGVGLDLHARRKDGTLVPVEISLSPLQTPEGTLVSSAIRDITERKRAEHALAESLERFRALADASPIGIVHLTTTGALDYANQTWRDITGVTDVHDTEALRRAVHPDDHDRMAELWRRCIKEGRDFAAEMRFVRPDGAVRWTSSRAVAVRDPKGTLTGFVSAVEDITDRRLAEEARLKEQEARLQVRRLQELAEFKTNFMRTAAHELGTPLTPIKLQLRVLRDLLARRAEPEERKAVTILERNVDRLQVLVRDLLESARLQSGRLRLNPRPMDLAKVVRDVVETFQEPAIQSGIALDADVPPRLDMVGDPDRIMQVLYNLLSNAMKFTPASGRVQVRAASQGSDIELTVKDTGSGFTKEQAANLFQPFSQVHDPMQVNKPGSGLGLYISKGIVDQHGGTITAYSEGQGKGATFRIRLPVQADAQSAPLPSTREAPAGRASGPT